MSMNMPNMLAYTIQSTLYSGGKPSVIVGAGRDATSMAPATAQDDSYWIVIINAKNPREKVKDWIVPGSSNSTIPPGIDTYMSDPDYLFAVATNYLSTLHVPQGAFYNFLVTYGAGRALQKLEQVNTVLSCGNYSRMSYILTGNCGPRGPKIVPPASYELSTFAGSIPALLLMSLMPGPGGVPPYSICDSYTFHT